MTWFPIFCSTLKIVQIQTTATLEIQFFFFFKETINAFLKKL